MLNLSIHVMVQIFNIFDIQYIKNYNIGQQKKQISISFLQINIKI